MRREIIVLGIFCSFVLATTGATFAGDGRPALKQLQLPCHEWIELIDNHDTPTTALLFCQISDEIDPIPTAGATLGVSSKTQHHEDGWSLMAPPTWIVVRNSVIHALSAITQLLLF